MIRCGKCLSEYGYAKAEHTHVVVTSPLDDMTYWWIGTCDNCGGWTELCLTPDEAKARIAKGIYACFDKNRKFEGDLTSTESVERSHIFAPGATATGGIRRQ